MRGEARFAAVRVRTADGPPQRIWDKGQQHLPGDEAWLIGEHRASGEKKYYLANLAAGMDLRSLAATIKARWICEQAHQQLKEELGLDHFEGRSWHGLHRHALMAMIAYAFLQHRRLKKVRRGKKINGPPPQPTLPAVRHAIVDLIMRSSPCDVRTADPGSARKSSVSKSAKVVLAPLADIPLPRERVSTLAPEELRRRQLAALINWVMAGARMQPVVLALEDLHWADPTTLDVLRGIAERGAGAPLVVLATMRPEFRAPWIVRSHHSVTSLGPARPDSSARHGGWAVRSPCAAEQPR